MNIGKHVRTEAAIPRRDELDDFVDLIRKWAYLGETDKGDKVYIAEPVAPVAE